MNRIMQENIIYTQQSDMGCGKGEYIFSNITLGQALSWFAENLQERLEEIFNGL